MLDRARIDIAPWLAHAGDPTANEMHEFGAARWWDVLYPANPLANGQWWISANRCGTNPSRTLFGPSRVIAPDGRVPTEARRGGEGDNPAAMLLICELDLAAELAARDRSGGVLPTGTRDGIAVAIHEEA